MRSRHEVREAGAHPHPPDRLRDDRVVVAPHRGELAFEALAQRDPPGVEVTLQLVEQPRRVRLHDLDEAV